MGTFPQGMSTYSVWRINITAPKPYINWGIPTKNKWEYHFMAGIMGMCISIGDKVIAMSFILWKEQGNFCQNCSCWIYLSSKNDSKFTAIHNPRQQLSPKLITLINLKKLLSNFRSCTGLFVQWYFMNGQQPVRKMW